MNRATALLRGLLARTIWARGVFGVPPDRYANLYRVILPALDLAMLWAGIGAINYGAPAFADFSKGGLVIGLAWGVWTTAASIACLVGLSFTKLLRLEAIGKSMLVASLVVYLLVLLVLTTGGSVGRFVAAGVSVGALLIAVWRLSDIRIEVMQRRRKQERDRLGEQHA